MDGGQEAGALVPKKTAASMAAAIASSHSERISDQRSYAWSSTKCSGTMTMTATGSAVIVRSAQVSRETALAPTSVESNGAAPAVTKAAVGLAVRTDIRWICRVRSEERRVGQEV